MLTVNSALCKKFVRESLLLGIALAIGLFSFSWFRVWIVSEVDTARFEQILELLPRDWRRFSPVNFEWLISYLGRTALTLDEPMIVMLISIWAIVRGSDVVSGELNRGTMEMILAQPISRTRVFVQHAALSIAGLLLMALLIWIGMSIAVWTTEIEESTYPTIHIPLTTYDIPITFLDPQMETIPMRERVRPVLFAPGIINMFCFGFFTLGLSMLFSSWDRFRWRTLGIVVGIYFFQAMIKVGAMASEKFRWLQYFTYFTLLEPAQAIEVADTTPRSLWYLFRYSETGEVIGLGPAGMNTGLLFFGTLFLFAGIHVFKKRDLPAPL